MNLSLLRDARSVLFHPAAFFRGRGRNPKMTDAIAVVIAVAVIEIVGTVASILAVFPALNAGAATAFTLGAGLGVIIGGVRPFLTWVLYAVAFFTLSTPFADRGTFRDTIVLVGWGFVARVPAALVAAITKTYVVTTLEESTAEAFRGHPLLDLNGYVGIVFLCWMGVIWTYAVAEARGLSPRQAALVVALPVAVGIGFELWGIGVI